MNEAAAPNLSPDFTAARKRCDLLAIVLAVSFLVTSLYLVVMLALLVWPEIGSFFRLSNLGGPHQSIDAVDLPLARRAAVVLTLFLGTAPYLLVFYHGRCIFVHFAKAVFFDAAVIRHVRAVGLWMFVAGTVASPVEGILFKLFAGIPINLRIFADADLADIIDIKSMLFLMGMAIQVVGFVMAEARRIADDNASFV